MDQVELLQNGKLVGDADRKFVPAPAGARSRREDSEAILTVATLVFKGDAVVDTAAATAEINSAINAGTFTVETVDNNGESVVTVVNEAAALGLTDQYVAQAEASATAAAAAATAAASAAAAAAAAAAALTTKPPTAVAKSEVRLSLFFFFTSVWRTAHICRILDAFGDKPAQASSVEGDIEPHAIGPP